MPVEVHHQIVERRAIDLLATLRSYHHSDRSTNIRRVAAYTVGGEADKDLLKGVVRALKRLSEDPDSRVVWADHPTDDRYDGAETDRPKRIQLRRDL